MKKFCNPTEICRRLDLRRGMKVIDIGCGAGRLSRVVRERVGPEGEVLGVDFQKGMLSKLERRNVDVKTRLGIYRLLPGDENYFDRALLVTVLGEIPDREGTLEDIYSTLKPGGILSITEVIPDPCYQGQNFVRGLAERVGFETWKSYSNTVAYTLNLRKPIDA